jgi:hypothetical protein
MTGSLVVGLRFHLRFRFNRVGFQTPLATHSMWRM